jgi:hypothetical protein
MKEEKLHVHVYIYLMSIYDVCFVYSFVLAVLGFELRPLHSNARTWEGEAGGT